jgi:hypothetical protein
VWHPWMDHVQSCVCSLVPYCAATAIHSVSCDIGGTSNTGASLCMFRCSFCPSQCFVLVGCLGNGPICYRQVPWCRPCLDVLMCMSLQDALDACNGWEVDRQVEQAMDALRYGLGFRVCTEP